MRRYLPALALSMLGIAASCGPASETAAQVDSAKDSPIDPNEVRKLILERVFPALGQAGQNPDALREVLAHNARLRWPNRTADGADAFIKTAASAFDNDLRLFAIAVSNYKFLVTKCGKTDPSLRPVGLPASIDVATFDPTKIGPDTLARHPGLLMPSIEPIKTLQGEQLAANRLFMVAKFKHSWFTAGQPAYIYVDRWIVAREGLALKVQEYEFTYDAGEFPLEPTPLTVCP